MEDSLDNRISIERLLSSSKVDVDVAENGKLGVEKALKNHYDLIFMDIQMPEMNGYEAMQELKKQNLTTPVVALTAHALKEEKQRAEGYGFADYLTKPISKQVLLQAVDRLTSTPSPSPS